MSTAIFAKLVVSFAQCLAAQKSTFPELGHFTVPKPAEVSASQHTWTLDEKVKRYQSKRGTGPFKMVQGEIMVTIDSGGGAWAPMGPEIKDEKGQRLGIFAALTLTKNAKLRQTIDECIMKAK